MLGPEPANVGADKPVPVCGDTAAFCAAPPAAHRRHASRGSAQQLASTGSASSPGSEHTAYPAPSLPLQHEPLAGALKRKRQELAAECERVGAALRGAVRLQVRSC